MKRLFLSPFVSLAALTLLYAGFGFLLPQRGDPGRAAPSSSPPPTEHILRKEAEKENRIKREAWLESLHRAAPGTDWREIEAANRRALALERQAWIEQGNRTNRWTEIGSANQAGRTHAAAYAESDGSVYIGTSLGGVWKGTIDGANWTPIADGLGLGSHGLLVVPGDPEVILSITDGGTCHATTNGGDTWFVPTGMPEYFMGAVRIVRDLGQPRTVYLLVKGAIDVEGQWYTGYHVLRSTDGGLNFERVHTEVGYTNRCDIWIDRVDPGPLYLMVNETMKISTDYGETFTVVGSAPDEASDVVLTGSEAGAPTFFAALSVGGQWKLYRSTTGGATWAWRNNIDDFWRTLVASITDSDLVYYAGVECFRSTNGGAGFTKVNNWWDYYDDPENKLHADHPGGECMMINGQEVFFLDTDGGTYVSYDGIATVQNISLYGLGISQYYGIFTSQTDPYLIAAGSQDQGYQVSDPVEGTPYLNFTQWISGDYGHLTSTERNHDWLYSVYPGFTLVQRQEAYPGNLQQVDFPAGASHSWMPFILADPLDDRVFYFCADHLWKFESVFGGSWNETELPQDFSPGFLTGLAISPADYNSWYAVTNQGKLWYSYDAGATWDLSPDSGPSAHYFYGTAIIASPTDPLVAWVGGAGYSGPAVYKTVDGGVSWTPMGDGLPSTLVFGLVLDNETDQTLYAAAEAGPYRYDAGTATWEAILGTEAPLTTYWCLESVPELNVIRFGTYGRGIWDYEILDPAAVEETSPLASGSLLAVYPNPARVEARFAVDLARPGRVTVEVFDVTGRRLATPLDALRPAGRHEVVYNLTGERGAPISNGIYLIRMATEGEVRIEKLQVLR